MNTKWKMKCCACIIIILQILVLYLPLLPELHLSILGILMISIFFFATWVSVIGYTELIIFGFLKDFISGHNIGCSAIEFITLLIIVDAIKKITSNRSVTTASIFFAFSIIIVTTLHEMILSFIYKRLMFSIKYWQFVVLYPMFLYAPVHVTFEKYIKFQDVRKM